MPSSFVSVRVTGDDRVKRSLRDLGLKTRHLERAWARIGAAIKRTAIPLTRVGATGQLVASIRSGKTKSSAVVRMGDRTRVVYAGVQNYGGYHNIEPMHSLNQALLRNRDTAENEVTDEINRLIRRAGLS